MQVINSNLLNPRKLSHTDFEKAVHHLLEENFEDGKYFTVIEERRKYNAQTSQFIWEQHMGRRPHVVEVYWKGEYVCDIRSDMQPREALNRVIFQMPFVKESLDPKALREKGKKLEEDNTKLFVEELKKRSLEKKKSIKIEKKDKNGRRKQKSK